MTDNDALERYAYLQRYASVPEEASELVALAPQVAEHYFKQHVRDNDAPTRELFERLGARRMGVDEWCLCDSISWIDGNALPWMRIPAFGNVCVDTIRKLRAACELLDIPWVYEVPT